MKVSKAYYRGCLLGGAIGDALGYPVQFMTLEEIQRTYGARGLREPILNDSTKKALISDNTQMTAFTTDGLLWADTRAKKKGIYAYTTCIFYAYQKWLYTQTGSFADRNYEFLLEGEILKWEELFAWRWPGRTCLAALSGSINGKYGTQRNRINSSKGCGAVMRAAPIGMYFCHDTKAAFKFGVESGAITHGHSTGFLTAGTFACLIAEILQGKGLKEAVAAAMAELKRHKYHEECFEALKQAVLLAGGTEEPYAAISSLGKGWTGESALAIAVYCALKFPTDFEAAIYLAVNHDGNSGGAGAICGNILGAYLGSLEIPYRWIERVELSELMVIGADRLLEVSK